MPKDSFTYPTVLSGDWLPPIDEWLLTQPMLPWIQQQTTEIQQHEDALVLSDLTKAFQEIQSQPQTVDTVMMSPQTWNDILVTFQGQPIQPVLSLSFTEEVDDSEPEKQYTSVQVKQQYKHVERVNLIEID